MLDSIMGAAPAVRRIQSLGARALFRAGIDADGATIVGAAIGVAAGIAFGRRRAPMGSRGARDQCCARCARRHDRARVCGAERDSAACSTCHPTGWWKSR